MARNSPCILGGRFYLAGGSKGVVVQSVRRVVGAACLVILLSWSAVLGSSKSEISRQIRFGADSGDFVLSGDRAQRLQELRVVREHDQALGDVDDLPRRRAHFDDARQLGMRCEVCRIFLGHVSSADRPRPRGHSTLAQNADTCRLRGLDSVTLIILRTS